MTASTADLFAIGATLATPSKLAPVRSDFGTPRLHVDFVGTSMLGVRETTIDGKGELAFVRQEIAVASFESFDADAAGALPTLSVASGAELLKNIAAGSVSLRAMSTTVVYLVVGSACDTPPCERNLLRAAIADDGSVQVRSFAEKLSIRVRLLAALADGTVALVDSTENGRSTLFRTSVDGSTLTKIEISVKSVSFVPMTSRYAPYIALTGLAVNQQTGFRDLLQFLHPTDNKWIEIGMQPWQVVTTPLTPLDGRLYVGMSGSTVGARKVPGGLYFVEPLAEDAAQRLVLLVDKPDIHDLVRCSNQLYFTASNDTELWQYAGSEVTRVLQSRVVMGLGCVDEKYLMFHDVSAGGETRINSLEVGDGSFVEQPIDPTTDGPSTPPTMPVVKEPPAEEGLSDPTSVDQESRDGGSSDSADNGGTQTSAGSRTSDSLARFTLASIAVIVLTVIH